MAIEYIDAESALFDRTPGGFLSLRLEGRKRFKRVHLYRLFPLSLPDSFISVRDEKEKEIGIIASLDSFPGGIVRMFREELDRRYFSPVIENLISIKEEFGYTYWDAETNAGLCRFTVKSGGNNVLQVSEDTILIIDVDGNRFTFPEFEQANSKYLKIIDTML